MYRRKFRHGIAIGLSELKADKAAARELNTEMLMHPGYVGFFDDNDMMARVYIFTSKESADDILKESKKMGFRTVGGVEEPFLIRNADLERPHLKYVTKSNWYRELYK